LFTEIREGLFLLMTLFPFFWMISTSFKIKGEFFTCPPIFIPDRFNFDAYRTALRSGGQKALIDSFIIAFISMCIALMLGTMGGYGLPALYYSRINVRSSEGMILPFSIDGK
jgi:multiple sugar transport system permease protein